MNSTTLKIVLFIRCMFILSNSKFSSFYDDVSGHSKSTFVEEGRGGGGGSLKSEQKRNGGKGDLTCVCVF